jgi:hypothetical protein
VFAGGLEAKADLLSLEAGENPRHRSSAQKKTKEPDRSFS